LGRAVELAATGLPCFPVSASKCPTTPHGFFDASTDPGVLRDLWAQHPGPLVGVVTGITSGIDVLDVDTYKPFGREWWKEHRHRIPQTRAHQTKRGGLHLMLQHAAGLRSSTGRIALGVDVKADGGYAIYWPAAGMPVLCDASSAPWPAWLLDAVRPKPSPAPEKTTPPGCGRTARRAVSRDAAHALRSFAMALDDVRS